MLNSGFSYSFDRRCIRSSPAETRSAIGVCANGDSGWLYSLDDALANSANGLSRARWVSYNWYSMIKPSWCVAAF